MKTIKQWLNTLEEPYRTQAINNTPKIALNETWNSLNNALIAAFTWKETKEGNEYWSNLYHEVSKREALQSLDKPKN